MKEDDITKEFLSDLAYVLKKEGSWMPKNHLVLACRPLWDKWGIVDKGKISEAFEKIAKELFDDGG